MDKAGPLVTPPPNRISFIPHETSNIYYPTVFPGDTLLYSARNSIQIILRAILPSFPPLPPPSLSPVFELNHFVSRYEKLAPLELLNRNGMEINSFPSPINRTFLSRGSISIPRILSVFNIKVNVERERESVENGYYDFACKPEQ